MIFFFFFLIHGISYTSTSQQHIWIVYALDDFFFFSFYPTILGFVDNI